MGFKKHWESIYSDKEPTEVTWFQLKPVISLDFIKELGLNPNDPIIDVGAGSSNLVDFLLELGFLDITLLDISDKALDNSKKRVGDKSGKVHFAVTDFKEYQSKKKFKLWHDRAVFHFLTHEGDRQIYREKLRQNLDVGGHFLISTFASDGPEKCSGLKVAQYSKEALIEEFSEDFTFLKSVKESHISPKGAEQRFIYCLFEKKA